MINWLKESEHHQHENGQGWIANTAKVEKTVYVGPNARVYGNAWEQSPLYIQGSRHSLTLASYTEIAIGCHLHTITFWEYNYQSIGEAEGYSEHEVEEYLGYIRLCEQYVVRHCKGKE